MKEKQRDDLRENTFIVTHETHFITYYGRFSWGPWDEFNEGPVPSKLPAACSLTDAVDDIFAHYHGDARWLNEEKDPGPDDGFGGLDLAVWRNNRLVAIIFPCENGDPEAMILSDQDLSGTDE